MGAWPGNTNFPQFPKFPIRRTARCWYTPNTGAVPQARAATATAHRNRNRNPPYLRQRLQRRQRKRAPRRNPPAFLERSKDGIQNPFTHEGLPEIRPTNTIQPTANPVDVPDAQEATGPLQATDPIGYSGPDQLGYSGQRVGPGQQYNMQGGTGVVPASSSA